MPCTCQFPRTIQLPGKLTTGAVRIPSSVLLFNYPSTWSEDHAKLLFKQILWEKTIRPATEVGCYPALCATPTIRNAVVSGSTDSRLGAGNFTRDNFGATVCNPKMTDGPPYVMVGYYLAQTICHQRKFYKNGTLNWNGASVVGRILLPLRGSSSTRQTKSQDPGGRGRFQGTIEPSKPKYSTRHGLGRRILPLVMLPHAPSS